MRRQDDGAAPRTGTFTLRPEENFFGQLTLKGAQSSLYLRDDSYVPAHDITDQYIKGILHDFTRVSLLHCFIRSGPGTFSRGNECYSFAEIFPHFVVSGDQHIGPTDKAIMSVEFVIDDAMTLFYDFNAFGHLLGDAQRFIEPIVHAQAEELGREIPIGPEPEIFYFTGKRQIFCARTALGTISASHRPTYPLLTGPRGLHLYNTIFVTINMEEPIVFNEAIRRVSIVRDYLGLLVGRQQNIEVLKLNVRNESESSSVLDVYWSIAPKRDVSKDDDLGPQSHDVLLNAILDPEIFSRVTQCWMERDRTWHDARDRFFSCFANQGHYDIDRLIGAANMFDILPSSAIPEDHSVPPEIEDAKKAAKEIFAKLPDSAERHSILSELGRIGKRKLKHKIRHRARKITDSEPNRFPDLTLVTDEAVNCRNHYVHGGDAKIDYGANFFETFAFFTDTLEFVFAASDLMEAGWNMKAWAAKGSSLSHPFSRYCYGYKQSLQRLKALLSN